MTPSDHPADAATTADGASAEEPRKQERRKRTERRILAAAERILTKKGFDALGINAIAAEAGVPKQLIYRYFETLDGVVIALMRQKDFWARADSLLPLGTDGPASAAAIDRFLNLYIDRLRADRRVQEIRRWELVSDGPVVRLVGQRREAFARQVLDRIGDRPGLDVSAALAIIQAGLTYLVLRSSTLPSYYGVPLDDTEGWDRIRAAVGTIVDALFGPETAGAIPASADDAPHPPDRFENLAPDAPEE